MLKGPPCYPCPVQSLYSCFLLTNPINLVSREIRGKHMLSQWLLSDWGPCHRSFAPGPIIWGKCDLKSEESCETGPLRKGKGWSWCSEKHQEIYSRGSMNVGGWELPSEWTVSKMQHPTRYLPPEKPFSALLWPFRSSPHSPARLTALSPPCPRWVSSLISCLSPFAI